MAETSNLVTFEDCLRACINNDEYCNNYDRLQNYGYWCGDVWRGYDVSKVSRRQQEIYFAKFATHVFDLIYLRLPDAVRAPIEDDALMENEAIAKGLQDA